MAVARKTPVCPYCGKETARAIVKNEKHVPIFMRKIGDNFLRWENIPHTCRGLRKARKEMKEWNKQYMKDHPEFQEALDVLNGKIEK